MIKKNTIKIGFKKVDADDTSFMNKIAMFFTSSSTTNNVYKHVEIIFSSGYVSSIDKTNGVHYTRDRQLSSGFYSRFFSLIVTESEERRMEEYAKQIFLNDVPFNWYGMYFNFIPCCISLDRKESAFFCSEYIVKILQTSGYLPELVSYNTSPTSLAEALMDDPHFKTTINHLPYKRK